MNPVKLSDARVRMLIVNPESVGRSTTPQNDEVRALAQAVIDLRMSVSCLEAACDDRDRQIDQLCVAQKVQS
jgi:hypothetical protein